MAKDAVATGHWKNVKGDLETYWHVIIGCPDEKMMVMMMMIILLSRPTRNTMTIMPNYDRSNNYKILI